MNFQPRKGNRQFLRSQLQMITGNIHRHVSAGPEPFKQDMYLGAAATTGFNEQAAGANTLSNFVRIGFQYLYLGAGRVILG